MGWPSALGCGWPSALGCGWPSALAVRADRRAAAGH